MKPFPGTGVLDAACLCCRACLPWAIIFCGYYAILATMHGNFRTGGARHRHCHHSRYAGRAHRAGNQFQHRIRIAARLACRCDLIWNRSVGTRPGLGPVRGRLQACLDRGFHIYDMRGHASRPLQRPGGQFKALRRSANSCRRRSHRRHRPLLLGSDKGPCWDPT